MRPGNLKKKRPAPGAADFFLHARLNICKSGRKYVLANTALLVRGVVLASPSRLSGLNYHV